MMFLLKVVELMFIIVDIVAVFVYVCVYLLFSFLT